MFSKEIAFPFQYKGSRKIDDGGMIFRRHTFVFRGKTKLGCYIVWVDEFEQFLFYAIKFFLKNHRSSKNKFNLLTNLNEFKEIIATCLEIILHLHEKNPFHSFGFIGANSEGELEKNTQRFRVYSGAMVRKLKPYNFTHHDYEEKSIYLLINGAQLENNPGLLGQLSDFFRESYSLKD